MSHESVAYEQRGRVVTLLLNRPDTRNALSRDVVDALVAGLERADADSSVSCAIVRGAGKGFSSGGNLDELKAMTTPVAEGGDGMDEAAIERWYTSGIQRIPLAFAAVDIVTIAAVHGHAIGAGCDLATMCDLRVAGESASFAESFVRVGLIPGDGGAWFLPRVVGRARAARMLFTAEPVDAATALDWGLVGEVVPDADLASHAERLAGRIAALPPVALREAKKLMRDSATLDLDEGLARAAKVQARLQGLDDHREAITAIQEKRRPNFTGT